MKFLLIHSVFLVTMALPFSTMAETNDLWFPVGEKLIYRLYWGIVPVGRAEFTSAWVQKDGARMIALRGTAKTGRFVSKIYPVDDFIESIVEPESFLPVSYIQKLNEGRHVRDDKIVFDRKMGKAYWESGLSDDKKEVEIDADTRDILTFVYYARSKGYEVGQQQKFRVLVDDKIYDLEVTGLKIQKIKVRGFGKIDCLKVEPKARFGEIFVRKGRVQLWFSYDNRRLCIRMTGKVPVASVKAILIGVEGPGDDM